MKSKVIALLALTMCAAGTALAQGIGVINIGGVVNKRDATTITVVNDDSGSVESFKLAPDLLVVQSKPATLADIRPNDFVASAAKFGADRKLHSTELRIFPDAMRGVGEGQRAMNDPQNQTMTNATVTGTAIVNGSNTITVRFNGGESELIIDPGVPVTRIDAVNIDLVKSGTKVRLRGTRTENGATINRIAVQ